MTEAESLTADEEAALRDTFAEYGYPGVDELHFARLLATLDAERSKGPMTTQAESRDAAAEVVRFYGTDRTWSLAYRTLLGSRIDDLDAALAATPPAEGLREALLARMTALAHLTPEDWDERPGADPIARTINACRLIVDEEVDRGR